ncbi:MAG: carboxypeptidase regulatory-like domain-containing protein [Candidatus Azobacteroides sp.]|nr:carboxypeptidase regulatory-like domain-containing protein [Candidatus Azobacteroides sp.]
MTTTKFKIIFSIAVLLAGTFVAIGQKSPSSRSVSGKVTDEKGEPVGYATVYIQNSVLGTVTSKDGLYSIRNLSPGDTILIVEQAGKKQVQVNINNKETCDITLIDFSGSAFRRINESVDADKTPHYIAEISTDEIKSAKVLKDAATTESYEGGSSAAEKAPDYVEIRIPESPAFPEAKAGMLTSGEVNDFSKWTLWEDIAEKTLSQYNTTWKMKPVQRYAVQLTTRKGMPIVDAEAQLIDDTGLVVWSAKTDNTGKAELWADMFLTETGNPPYHIVFNYSGLRVTLKNAAAFPEKINTAALDVDCNKSNAVDILFVVDATGSMQDEINYLQAELYDVIEKVKKDNAQLQLRMGSVFYRDHGDAYLTRASLLDENIDKTINFIGQQHADGGGDEPEAVDYALIESVAKMNWNENALSRIAFLILDAPPHNDNASIVRVRSQIRSAAEKGIRLIPIACSGTDKSAEYLFRCMALATNGTYVFLTDDSGIGNPHIKPTTDEYKVEKLNEIFIRLIKQYTEIPDCQTDAWIPQMQQPQPSDQHLPTPYQGNPTGGNIPLTLEDIMIAYPNPCDGILNVEMKCKESDVYLCDISGKSMQRFKTKENEQFTVNMAGYSAGVYFLRAFYNDKWFTYKFILK